MLSERRESPIINERLIVSFVMFAVMATLLIRTFSISNPISRTLPFVIAIPTVIFCLIDLIKVIRENLKNRLNNEESEQETKEKKQNTLKELAAFSSFAVYIFMVWLFSFLIISPIFAFLMSKFYFKTTTKFAAISAAVVLAVVYLLFFQILSIYGVGSGVVLTII